MAAHRTDQDPIADPAGPIPEADLLEQQTPIDPTLIDDDQCSIDRADSAARGLNPSGPSPGGAALPPGQEVALLDASQRDYDGAACLGKLRPEHRARRVARTRTVTGLRVSIETIARHEASVSLALRGEFDLENISIVRIALADHVLHGRSVIRLDMSGVEYMDSTMMGALVEAHQQCQDNGGVLILTEVPDRVRRILCMGGLDGLLVADGVDN